MSPLTVRLMTALPAPSWRDRLPAAVRPYLEPAPLAAFALGISSGTPLTMIAATLTTRLAQAGISRKSVTAFAIVLTIYNLKFLWSPLFDRLRRVPALAIVGVAAMGSIMLLGSLDPKASLRSIALAATLVAVLGATLDIIIDAYRIELLAPHQLSIGSGTNQYGYRLANATAAALALVIAARWGWSAAYAVCALFVLPGLAVGLVMGEPLYRRVAASASAALNSATLLAPFVEFLHRPAAVVILSFAIIHKLGDTLANLSLRVLFNDLHFSNDEIAQFDTLLGLGGFLLGVFLGTVLLERVGLKRAVLVSLVLMAVSNLGFAGLAIAGHSIGALAGAVGLENVCSGIGGVTVVAFFSAICDTRFTATQYALLSAAASVVGRLLAGTTTGALIDRFGYVDFYLFTTVIALPGVVLFWWMARAGMVDRAVTREDAG